MPLRLAMLRQAQHDNHTQHDKRESVGIVMLSLSKHDINDQHVNHTQQSNLRLK